MRTENTTKPEKFKINQIGNGKCTVLFFDNIVEEIVQGTENQEETKKYVYDMYEISVNSREDLLKEIEDNYEKWLDIAKKDEYNKLAEEIREKRNELLKETDKEMCIDRLNFNFPENLSMTNIITALKDFFDGFSNISKSNIAKYRQELRDITKQKGFPYNIVWPTKDENKED